MKTANIRITLQPRENSYANVVDLVFPIDDIIGMMENRPIDHHCMIPPESRLNPFYSTCEIHMGLIKGRKGTAEYISKVLTEKIMEIFAKDDTIDGFSLKEWKEMYNCD